MKDYTINKFIKSLNMNLWTIKAITENIPRNVNVLLYKPLFVSFSMFVWKPRAYGTLRFVMRGVMGERITYLSRIDKQQIAKNI